MINEEETKSGKPTKKERKVEPEVAAFLEERKSQFTPFSQELLRLFARASLAEARSQYEEALTAWQKFNWPTPWDAWIGFWRKTNEEAFFDFWRIDFSFFKLRPAFWGQVYEIFRNTGTD